MDNSLLVGKYVYKLLSEDVVLSAKVSPKKIFPLVANGPLQSASRRQTCLLNTAFLPADFLSRANRQKLR